MIRPFTGGQGTVFTREKNLAGFFSFAIFSASAAFAGFGQSSCWTYCMAGHTVWLDILYGWTYCMAEHTVWLDILYGWTYCMAGFALACPSCFCAEKKNELQIYTSLQYMYVLIFILFI